MGFKRRWPSHVFWALLVGDSCMATSGMAQPGSVTSSVAAAECATGDLPECLVAVGDMKSACQEPENVAACVVASKKIAPAIVSIASKASGGQLSDLGALLDSLTGLLASKPDPLRPARQAVTKQIAQLAEEQVRTYLKDGQVEDARSTIDTHAERLGAAWVKRVSHDVERAQAVLTTKRRAEFKKDNAAAFAIITKIQGTWRLPNDDIPGTSWRWNISLDGCRRDLVGANIFESSGWGAWGVDEEPRTACRILWGGELWQICAPQDIQCSSVWLPPGNPLGRVGFFDWITKRFYGR